MNQRLFNRYNVSATALLLAIAVGCGRSEPTDTPVVDPPSPAAITDESSTKPSSNRTDMSGGLEMPEGAVPTSDSNSTPTGSSEKGGGIEMPDDAGANQSSIGQPPANGPGDSRASADKSDSSGTASILYASWNEIQAAAETSGKVTVVDLWSLTCEPCLKEFPGLVRLHNEMGNSVQCIAVDMDYDGRRTRPPERYADQVGIFLDSVGATGFPTYISSTPSDDIFTAMKIASLPAVLVYQADGSIAKVFVDAGDTAGFTYEKDIRPLVNDLSNRS